MRLLSLLSIALTSCTAGSSARVVPVAPPESCLTGTVSAVGTDFDLGTILRPDNGQEIRIAGEEEIRLRVLSGAVVTVCGELMTGARDVSTIEAQSFELRAVDGMTAYLGTLEEVHGGWQLNPKQSGAPVPLSGVPEQLGEAEGSLVWVAGSWMDEAFSVKSFGLMAPVISSQA